MTTNERVQKRIETIKDQAPIAALQGANHDGAVSDEFKARQELLLAALEAARPAWKALSSNLPIKTSRSGCEMHEVLRGTDRRGEISAVRVLPNVAMAAKEPTVLGGARGWTAYLDREPFNPGRCGCFDYDWQPLSLSVLLREVSLVDLVEGLAQAIEEQLTGGRLKSALQFEARAKRLRAVALLLGESR